MLYLPNKEGPWAGFVFALYPTFPCHKSCPRGQDISLPATFYAYCRHHFDIAMVLDSIPRSDPPEPPACLSAEDQIWACWAGKESSKSRPGCPSSRSTLIKIPRFSNSSSTVAVAPSGDMARRDLLTDLWHPTTLCMALDGWDSDSEDGMC
jgi:hypothetical protein